MKAENKIPVTKKSRNRSTEAKPAVARAWVPQPSPLTREEVRRLVIDQIG